MQGYKFATLVKHYLGVIYVFGVVQIVIMWTWKELCFCIERWLKADNSKVMYRLHK